MRLGSQCAYRLAPQASARKFLRRCAQVPGVSGMLAAPPTRSTGRSQHVWRYEGQRVAGCRASTPRSCCTPRRPPRTAM
eukprot:6202418-Pleurochrysis_carterae.AAC.2